MTFPAKGEENDGYAGVLGRGGSAEWRLTFQHFVTTQQQGYAIHPKIEKALSMRKNLQIVDLATGNGIWALDVAERYPDAHVLGTDISDKQFPRLATRLPNTKFELQNMYDDVPQKYHGAFDIVHLRLTIGWIIRQDKELLMRNVLSMVKPGGFVQWSEIVNPPLWIYEPGMEAYAGLPTSSGRVLRLSGMLPEFEWLTHLAETFRQHGMVEAESFDPKPTGSNLQAQGQCLAWGMQEVAETLIKVGVPDAERQYALALEELNEEYAQGKHFAYHWQIAIARKPN